MDKLSVLFKVVFTSIGGIFGYLFGEWAGLIHILLAFVILDYLTGLIAGGLGEKLSSKVGFKGIAKKVMILALVAVAHLVDQALGGSNMIRDAVIFFYLSNELLSIIENAGHTGLPIPEQMTNAIEVLKGKSKEKSRED